MILVHYPWNPSCSSFRINISVVVFVLKIGWSLKWLEWWSSSILFDLFSYSKSFNFLYTNKIPEHLIKKWGDDVTKTKSVKWRDWLACSERTRWKVHLAKNQPVKTNWCETNLFKMNTSLKQAPTGLENCWANFKTFSRIQDSVRI